MRWKSPYNYGAKIASLVTYHWHSFFVLLKFWTQKRRSTEKKKRNFPYLLLWVLSPEVLTHVPCHPLVACHAEMKPVCGRCLQLFIYFASATEWSLLFWFPLRQETVGVSSGVSELWQPGCKVRWVMQNKERFVSALVVCCCVVVCCSSSKLSTEELRQGVWCVVSHCGCFTFHGKDVFFLHVRLAGFKYLRRFWCII